MFDGKPGIVRAISAEGRDGPQFGFTARFAVLIAAASSIVGLIFFFGGDLLFWASATMKSAQADLAKAVRAVRSGEAFAMASLLAACFIYGFAHAVGPGHGKLLIAGAATASRKTAWRIAGIGFLASLTQALSAVLLTYGALGLFSLTGRAAVGLSENWLTPLSAAAVTMVGVWLIWRGLSGLIAQNSSGDAQEHSHSQEHTHGDHVCDDGCKHLPSVREAEKADSWFETLSLIFSIGVRPCSGALIVLAIAWNFGLYFAGVLSALAMAVGTGLVVSGVAVFAASFRDAQSLRGSDAASRQLRAWVQIGAGAAVALLSGLVVVASIAA